MIQQGNDKGLSTSIAMVFAHPVSSCSAGLGIRLFSGPTERRLEALTWLIADCSRGSVLGLWTSSGGEELLETVAHARSFLVDGRRARSHMQNQRVGRKRLAILGRRWWQ